MAILHAAGCARWKADAPPRAEETSGLPRPRMSRDAVVIETAFVPIPESADGPELWNAVNESALDPALRRALAANGLRAGVIGGDLPALLRFSATSGGADDLKLLEDAGLASDLSHSDRRIQCRPGRPYELPTREQVVGAHPLLLALDERLSGTTLRNPLPLFVLAVDSEPDGRVRLRLEPKVRHGELRQSWAAQDHALKISHRRDEVAPRELAVAFTLAPGQSAIVAPSEPARGLGKLMLAGERVDGRHERTALVVRLAQLQSPRLDTAPPE